MIPPEYIADFVARHYPVLCAGHFSFFEVTTAMAFCWFRDRKVDLAVVEAGLGGRLDSTNVITPLLSIITNIALDHTAVLGDTRTAIAAEKAGIVKPGIPLLVGECDPEVEPVFRRATGQMGAPLYFADHGIDYSAYPCSLQGDYQRYNIATVVAACGILRDSLGLTQRALQQGLLRVTERTGLMGRWQVVGEKPCVVCDTGHNVNGIGQVVRQLARLKKKELRMVFGMVGDKDVDGALALLPREARYYFTRSSVSRAMDSAELARRAARFSLRGEAYPDCVAAFSAAMADAGEHDVVFVGGSTFVVADVLAFLQTERMR